MSCYACNSVGNSRRCPAFPLDSNIVKAYYSVRSSNAFKMNGKIRMNDQIKNFIHEQSDLFWFLPESDKENISTVVLVETILNYGSLDAVIKLVHLIGVDLVARTFAESLSPESRRRNNYHELTRNYFLHVFKNYAPQYFNQSAA